MTLNEIQFDKMKSVRVRCIELSRKTGNTVVRHWLDLYPAETITGNEEMKGFYMEAEAHDYFTDYMLWNDCGGDLAVKYFRLREETDISELSEILERNTIFKGYEGYKRRLVQKEKNGSFINMAEIAALIELGDIDLASHYSNYRGNYMKMQEEKDHELELQRQKKRQEEIDMEQRALEAKIADAEECIRMGKMLQNDLLDTGNHLVLYLMKKYDISIPLKTQGWINNKLSSVMFNKDGTITVYFLKRKGCKCSQSVYKYLGLLKTAVEKAA